MLTNADSGLFRDSSEWLPRDWIMEIYHTIHGDFHLMDVFQIGLTETSWGRRTRPPCVGKVWGDLCTSRGQVGGNVCTSPLVRRMSGVMPLPQRSPRSCIAVTASKPLQKDKQGQNPRSAGVRTSLPCVLPSLEFKAAGDFPRTMSSDSTAGRIRDAAESAAEVTRVRRASGSFHRTMSSDSTARRIRDTAESAAEATRVRRWSTRSDEQAVETMQGLTSAPSILIGGCIMFLDPTADVTRIRQLPSLQRDAGVRPKHAGQGPAVSRDAFLRRLPASRPKFLRKPSTESSADQASVTSISRKSPQITRGRSPAVANPLFTAGTSPQISESRTSSVASARSDGASLSLAITRTPSDDLFTRANSDLFTRATSDSHATTRIERSVTGQARTRPFVRSARFGEPADWGLSATVRSQRAFLCGKTLGGQKDIFGRTESCPETSTGTTRRSSRNEGGGSSGNNMLVFQPVRPRW